MSGPVKTSIIAPKIHLPAFYCRQRLEISSLSHSRSWNAYHKNGIRAAHPFPVLATRNEIQMLFKFTRRIHLIGVSRIADRYPRLRKIYIKRKRSGTRHSHNGGKHKYRFIV